MGKGNNSQKNDKKNKKPKKDAKKPQASRPRPGLVGRAKQRGQYS